MKTSGTLTFLLLIFIGFSCSNNSEVKELQQQVMKIHDEVMPEMGSLMELKGELQEKLASIDTIRIEEKERIKKAIRALEHADESMMQWMRNYKHPSEDLSKEEALAYLRKKEEEIKKVAQDIKESKTAALQLLNKQ